MQLIWEITEKYENEQKPPWNNNADVSGETGVQNVGLNLHLHLYFLYVSS